MAAAAMMIVDAPSGYENRYDDLGAFCETMLLTGAMAGGLKLAVDRDRPNGEDSDSFPSAHVMFSFATASFLDEAYKDSLGWRVSVPAYALATFVGLSRMERRKHWASDVAVGAALGILIGKTVGSIHYGEGGVNRRFEIAPVITPDGVAIMANFRF